MMEADLHERLNEALKQLGLVSSQWGRAEAELAKARDVIRPFAGDKMPCLQRTELAFNRDGLRCLMSPMEIARTAARAFLEEKR